MAKRRTKREIIAGITEAEAKAAMKAYADAASNLKDVESQIELECNRIHEKFAVEVSKLQAEKETLFNKLQVYAEANRENLFANRKSLDWQTGKLGFRVGNPSVVLVKGFKTEQAINLLRKAGLPYTQTKLAIDKKAILGAKDNPKVMAQVNDCGLVISQKESFFVEPYEVDLNGN